MMTTAKDMPPARRAAASMRLADPGGTICGPQALQGAYGVDEALAYATLDVLAPKALSAQRIVERLHKEPIDEKAPGIEVLFYQLGLCLPADELIHTLAAPQRVMPGSTAIVCALTGLCAAGRGAAAMSTPWPHEEEPLTFAHRAQIISTLAVHLGDPGLLRAALAAAQAHAEAHPLLEVRSHMGPVGAALQAGNVELVVDLASAVSADRFHYWCGSFLGQYFGPALLGEQFNLDYFEAWAAVASLRPGVALAAWTDFYTETPPSFTPFEPEQTLDCAAFSAQVIKSHLESATQSGDVTEILHARLQHLLLSDAVEKATEPGLQLP